MFLQRCLDDGLSLEQIAKRIGRHPSTVSYHLKKHGLLPVGHAIHAPNRRVDPERLRELIGQGATVRVAAAALGVGYSTVRYWLKRLDLETQTLRRRREGREARRMGAHGVMRTCPKHGRTTFVSRIEGGYRCGRCRVEAVGRWRRGIKKKLVERAGGACVVCGYSRHHGALHFHHLDPGSKEFTISRNGNTRSYEELPREADKCVLLCANCHAEIEGGLAELPVAALPLRLRSNGHH
jgi:transposase